MGGAAFPRLIGKDLGDALWTVMFYWIAVLIWPRIAVAIEGRRHRGGPLLHRPELGDRRAARPPHAVDPGQ